MRLAELALTQNTALKPEMTKEWNADIAKDVHSR